MGWDLMLANINQPYSYWGWFTISLLTFMGIDEFSTDHRPTNMISIYLWSLYALEIQSHLVPVWLGFRSYPPYGTGLRIPSKRRRLDLEAMALYLVDIVLLSSKWAETLPNRELKDYFPTNMIDFQGLARSRGWNPIFFHSFPHFL